MVADPDDAEKSVTTSYAYDAHGQVTSVTREDGSVVRYAYDAVGNVVSERYFATAAAATPEIAITYTYTGGGGRLVSAEQVTGSGETQQSVTTSYSYDEYGRVTQQRQETEAEAGALTVNYRYNAAGQVTAVAYAKESAQGAVDPGNTELHILWYTYDDAGRLSAIHLDEGTANTTSPTSSSRLIRSYAYNAYGEIEKITDNTSFLTGGTLTTELTYTYNDYGLPVKLTYTDVDGETRTVREETNLTYDGNGNILTEAVTEAYSGSTTKTRTYQYDLGNRLISAAYDGTTTTYTYDAVGNRLTRQEGTETAETYTYNYLNQLTRVQQGTAVTTYAYDARGNQTQQVQTGTGVTTTSTYGYDLANRLISSSVTNNAVNPLSTGATYAYNAQGQRVTRVEDEVVTHFYYTGSALLFTTVNEYVLQTQNILDPSGTIVASKRFEGQAETGQDPYAEDYFFYRYDIRGSVTTIVDGEGAVVKSYDYDEFGVTTASGEAFFNEVTFTGSISDASGLLYMNARYYNPATARFLSQDSYTGSAFDPWTQHLYAYCNNNPVNMIDPTGHVAQGISLGGDGVTPIWLYREIHWAVQSEIGLTTGYFIEKGVRFPNGGFGRIDVIETTSGRIWEVKHYNSKNPARTLWSAQKQLSRYLTSTIIDESLGVEQPFVLGDMRFAGAQFPYTNMTTGKNYLVEYWSMAEGVIAYEFWEVPDNRVRQEEPAWAVVPRRETEKSADSVKGQNIRHFPNASQDKKPIAIAAAALGGGLALGITFGGSSGYRYKGFGY